MGWNNSLCLPPGAEVLTPKWEWTIPEGGKESSFNGRIFRVSEPIIDSPKIRRVVMQMFRIRRKKSIRGLTLIELLMVILIVGILAAIAVPTYSNYMMRARRADAKTALEQVRAAQEMWRAEKGNYAVDDGLGTAVTKLRVTMGAPNTTVSNYYTWAFSAGPTATTFTAQATAIGSQATDGWLAINQDGTKTSQYANKWLK